MFVLEKLKFMIIDVMQPNVEWAIYQNSYNYSEYKASL